MKKSYLLYAAIILAWMAVVWTFTIDYERNKQAHDRAHTENFYSAYNSAVHSYENTYKLFFRNIVNTREIKEILASASKAQESEDIARGQLYKELKREFSNFKSIGFTNLLFTDAKGVVLLRMGAPEYYGDNTLDVRQIVSESIKTKEYATGFEAGRFFAGVSFCYPLLLNGELIATATATISTANIAALMDKNFGGEFEFIIEKSIIEKNMTPSASKNFTQSGISPLFVTEPIGGDRELSKRSVDQLRMINLQTGDAAKIVHLEHANGVHVGITMMPIRMSSGKYGAYLLHYAQGSHAADMQTSLIVKLLLVSSLFLFLLIAAWRQKTIFVKLQESEAHYKTLFDQAAIGFCHITPQGKFLLVNQKLCDILGYTKEELLAMDIFEISHHEDIQISSEHIRTMLAGELDSYTIEKRYIKKNGEPVWVRITAGYVAGKNGNSKYIIGAIDDIDDEVKTKHLLNLQKSQMDAILGAMPSMVFIKDAKHRMVYANQAACDFLGYADMEEIKGKSTFELVPPNEAQRLFEVEERVHKNGETLANFEERITSADGESRIILSTRQPFMLENGEMGLLGVSSDITTLYEARRISAILRKFFDNTEEAMVIADEKGNIKRVNDAFTKITGYDRDEVEGNNPRVLKSGMHDEAFYVAMWDDILTQGRWVGEIYNRRKSGEIYPEWLAITAIKGDNGEITNYISTFMVKEKEELIKRQSELLVSQSRYAAMGEMIGMIAHQWRQPITAIGMSANNMLLDIDLGDIDADTFRTHLNSIGSQVQFLSSTIDDFRNFFKPSSETVVVSVSFIISEALKIIGKSLENNNIAVSNDKNCDFEVEVHKGELTQVLLVLLGNAKDILIDNSVQNAFVSIVCENGGDGYVKVGVADNGGGVPEEIMAKIFEPYFSTKAAKNGTGLGLYIAKTIVEKYQGGSIGVENRDGGAYFWIRLPIKS